MVKPMASFCANSSTFCLPIVGKDVFQAQTVVNWELLPCYEQAPANMVAIRILKVDKIKPARVTVIMTSARATNPTAINLTAVSLVSTAMVTTFVFG